MMPYEGKNAGLSENRKSKNEDICVDLGGYKDMKALQHSSAVQLG